MTTITRQQRRQHFETQLQEVYSAHAMQERTPEQLVELLATAVVRAAGAAQTALLERGKAALDALIAGLKHEDGKVRATCALLLDHLAEDRCVNPLLDVIRHDPLEAVRRCALHALACEGCKACPLNVDAVEALLEVGLNDRSRNVRRRAMFYLTQHGPDRRVVTSMPILLQKETDPVVRCRADLALQHHESAQT